MHTFLYSIIEIRPNRIPCDAFSISYYTHSKQNNSLKNQYDGGLRKALRPCRCSFLKGKQGYQILARKLIIFNFGSLQNRPLIHQTLAILASIQCLVDG